MLDRTAECEKAVFLESVEIVAVSGGFRLECFKDFTTDVQAINHSRRLRNGVEIQFLLPAMSISLENNPTLNLTPTKSTDNFQVHTFPINVSSTMPDRSLHHFWNYPLRKHWWKSCLFMSEAAKAPIIPRHNSQTKRFLGKSFSSTATRINFNFFFLSSPTMTDWTLIRRRKEIFRRSLNLNYWIQENSPEVDEQRREKYIFDNEKENWFPWDGGSQSGPSCFGLWTFIFELILPPADGTPGL